MTEIKTRKLDGVTVIHDLDDNAVIGRIDGVVVLPVGAIVELAAPRSARVERVRLLDGDPATVCLDVRKISLATDPS